MGPGRPPAVAWRRRRSFIGADLSTPDEPGKARRHAPIITVARVVTAITFYYRLLSLINAPIWCGIFRHFQAILANNDV